MAVLEQPLAAFPATFPFDGKEKSGLAQSLRVSVRRSKLTKLDKASEVCLTNRVTMGWELSEGPCELCW